jgi:hypothetical protein
MVSRHKLESSETPDFVLFSTLIFLFCTMLFMDRLEFSCFGDFLQGYLKPEKTMVFFKIHQKKGLWIAWSKRLESLVKLMSKKSIYESALILSCWIRIRIRIRNADPDQVYKLTEDNWIQILIRNEKKFWIRTCIRIKLLRIRNPGLLTLPFTPALKLGTYCMSEELV